MATATPDGGKLVQVIDSDSISGAASASITRSQTPGAAVSDDTGPIISTAINRYAYFQLNSFTVIMSNTGTGSGDTATLISRHTPSGNETVISSVAVTGSGLSRTASFGAAFSNIYYGSDYEFFIRISNPGSSGGGINNGVLTVTSIVLAGIVLVYQKPA